MNTKVTILNKLRKSDSVTGVDVWYKSFLPDVAYKKEVIRDLNGTNVSVSETITILIPFDSKYTPYLKWKDLADKENYYTLSVGDLIFLDVYLEEEPTPNIISTLRTKYASVCCDVKSIEEVEQKYGVIYRLKVGAI